MDKYDVFVLSAAGYSRRMEAFPAVKILEQSYFECFRGKRVVFITTKNIDYIRNVQEVESIKKHAESLKVICSAKKSYAARLVDIYIQIFLTSFKKYDCVFVGFSPQLVCPVWGWKFCCPLVADFFISVYDTFVNDRAAISGNGLLASLARWVDKTTLKKASLIISDTKAHAEYFISEFGARADKVGVLYLQANSQIYFPRKAAKRKDFHGKYVVLYFGSILPLQGVEVVLNCIKLLRCDDSVFFQIIGPVSEKDKLEQDNVEFIPWLSEEDLAQYIAACDLCLAGHFSNAIDKAKRTIAGKAYIYEAMKKPMVLGDNPANRELFAEDEMHYFVEMGKPEALADIILKARCRSSK